MSYLIVLLVALGGLYHPNKYHEDFRPHIEQFEADWSRYTGEKKRVYMDIKFKKIYYLPVLGYCDHRKRAIFINERSWKKLNRIEKKLLIYHELGHCVLDRRHDESIFINGEPKSIMHPNGITWKQYRKSKRYYDRELFGVSR